MKNILFILTISPWPLFLSFSILILSVNLINFINYNNIIYLLISFLCTIIIIFNWFNDVLIESTFSGSHNKYIKKFTSFRIIIFILSEIFFFIRFFWSYIHFLFCPDIIIGSIWPPNGIYPIKLFNLPLINSLLLIRRGFSITWRHLKIIYNDFNKIKYGIIISILFGLIFIICQLFEYYLIIFSIRDRIFGSIFFISTGFHGIHVFVGLLFLFVILIRQLKFHFSKNHIIGYEFSIWYWHFVDVVWLYIYIIIYWLGI
jgi:cytochrome c oxidase subunit 3